VTKRTWKVHAIAECEDCGAHWENYKNAQATAAIHAKKYHHKVSGDVGLAFEYDGRDEMEVTHGA
jgi:hypothetical protein